MFLRYGFLGLSASYCPVTGSSKIHLMGTVTSEIYSISSLEWEEDRDEERWEEGDWFPPSAFPFSSPL
jgi:hypothetical protein